MYNADNENLKRMFKEHVATLTDAGNIKILDFQKPGSNIYRIRFLFEEDYCRLHISGDLGELTAVNFNNMTYEGFRDFVHSPDYFTGKIRTHDRPLYEWDEEEAEAQLRKMISDNEYEEDILKAYTWQENEQEAIDEFISDVMEDFSYSSGISQKGYSALTDTLPDEWEGVEDYGKRSTGILDIYLGAFEMAQEQLREHEITEEKER